MSDVQIVRAGHHALTLMVDIRENAVRECEPHEREFLFDDFAELHEHATESSVHYFIGFSGHMPFGYLRTSVDDKEAEIRGPFMYPDYSNPALSAQLIEHTLEFLRKLKVQLIYCLAVPGQAKLISIYSDLLFEDLSSEGEFLRRWHDGILADRRIPPGTRLLVRLLEISEPDPDSI